MSFWDFLYRLLIYPLELIFEVIYTISEKYIQNPGLSIIVLSLVMNILVLPLYMKADRLQEEAREKESRLAPAVRRIRETFKGDERFMMLSAYYRENDYSPLSSLKGSLSLLLEIPFFISAYHFLSNLGYIRGVSLGPLKDLGSPDGLIVIGSVTLNLLPVLMTLINIISSYIYAKDFPKKTKIQLYIIAGIFLVLLYNSPSGLVFYWVLNNLFSLFKNVFYKIRHSRTVLGILSMCTGICLSIASFNLDVSGSVPVCFFFQDQTQRDIIRRFAAGSRSCIYPCRFVFDLQKIYRYQKQGKGILSFGSVNRQKGLSFMFGIRCPAERS